MKNKILLRGLLISIVLIGFSGLAVFCAADTPPAGATVEVLDWTYFKDSDHSVDAYFNLYLNWTENPSAPNPIYVQDWVPAFCLDSGIFWGAKPDKTVVASDDPLLPTYMEDENLTVINYLMNQWHSDRWSAAGWEEIQWAIWHYSDMSDPTGGGAYPSYNPGILATIISDIDDDIDDGTVDDWPGPYTIYILDPGDDNQDGVNDKQLVFFEIPEVPLGTITSLTAMAGGFLYRKKYT